MHALRALLMAGACLAATGLFAQDAEQFLIESELWLNGERQQVPVMVVGENEPGFLLNTNDQGRVEEGGWRLEFTANLADDPLNLSDALWVNVLLSVFESDSWNPVLDSMLGVPEGEFSSLSVGTEGEESSPENAEIFLRLRTSRMRQADD